MAEPDNQLNVNLPEGLQKKFTALERRLWKVETALAVSISFLALGASYLILFFSDRFWDSPVWFRSLVFLAGIAALIFAFYGWIKNWILNRRDWRALANLVQNKFRRLGDRLLGIVELSSEQKHAANFSPELYHAAIHQVAAEAEKFDFREAIDVRPAKRFISVASLMAGILLLIGILFPAVGLNVLQRWLAPGAAVSRHTLVSIENLPAKLIVPHGESFSVSGDVNYRSFWKPRRAAARFESQAPVVNQVAQNKAAFSIPAQTQNGILKIKIGDAEKEVAIVPSHRPSLKQLSATIYLPEYLKYPATNQIVPSGTLNLLEGSKVSFNGKISRELKSGLLQIETSSVPMKIAGDEFSTEPLERAGNFQIAFSWQDNLGLSNSAPWKLAIQSQKDLPPSPAFSELTRDVAMLHTDVLHIKTEARDDFGVRDLGLFWNVDSLDSQPVSRERKFQASTSQQKTFAKVFQWSPAVYGIPPNSTVALQSFSSDFFPGRDRVESAIYRLHILGNEQHAEMVRQQLESLLMRVEEIARLEEKILAKTGDLLADKKISPTEAAEKIGAVNQDQMKNAQQLEELAKEGMKTLQEALKNPTFTEDALKEWSKNLQDMQKLSQQEMKQASADLKSAQQNASQSEAKEKSLAKAQKKQEEITDALQKMQGKVNKGLDDLQAMTLAQRLRKVGADENEISDQLQKVVAETIGLMPAELSPKLQKLNATLADGQENAQKESGRLQGEIDRFFERTQKTNYGFVSKEIKEARTVEELERLRDLIAKNVAMEATRNLTNWSQRFAEWADQLEPKESAAAGGKGEGGGAKPEDMTKKLIALLRLREKEINLQTQTRLLDEKKGEDFKERADGLFSTQKKLGDELALMEKENRLATLARPFNETRRAMEEVESLLSKPQTDNLTAQAQEKTVDLLSDIINLINEQAQRNPPPAGSGSQSAEEMAFLMKMMAQAKGMGKGMAISSEGGGNTQGGSTDRVATRATGNANGRSGTERTVNKASGAASVNLPAEFRDTLENYFKAIEQEGN